MPIKEFIVPKYNKTKMVDDCYIKSIGEYAYNKIVATKTIHAVTKSDYVGDSGSVLFIIEFSNNNIVFAYWRYTNRAIRDLEYKTVEKTLSV